MGKMISLADFKMRKAAAESARVGSQQWTELNAAVTDGILEQRVQSELDRLAGRTAVTVLNPGIHLIYDIPARERRGGTLFVASPIFKNIVTTSDGFPRFLNKNSGLSEEDSTRLAASMVIAYAAVNNWMRELAPAERNAVIDTACLAGIAPVFEDEWGYSGSEDAVVKRLSGTVALGATGLESLGYWEHTGIPAHLVSLKYPFQSDEHAHRVFDAVTIHGEGAQNA